MTVYEYEQIRHTRLIGERVIALGFFDGVHVGHRALLRTAAREAAALCIPFAVFTFRAESLTGKDKTRLYGTDQKLSLLERCGADEVIVADFEDMKDMSAEDFALDFLIRICGARIAVSGKDFRFGSGAEGSASTLAELFADHGRRAIAIEDVVMFKKKVSTTEIKDYLADGSIICANAMLGSTFFLEGVVTHGNGEGKRLGYPTVNCDMTGREELLMRGVYVTRVEVDGKKYPSVTNVGACPTLGERRVHAETYIIGFGGDLYGKRVRIYFYRFLREEMLFESAEQLGEQIKRDIEQSKKINEEIL